MSDEHRQGPDRFAAHHKLMAGLTAKAAWMGSRDPENAAQETLERTLRYPLPGCALHYYFGADASVTEAKPEWPLERLLAWLSGVLNNVVSEERARVGYHRERAAIDEELAAVADGSSPQLDVLIGHQLISIVRECLSSLSTDQRRVLELRVAGLKYSEIARQLGLRPGTVATRIRRAMIDLSDRVRGRMGGPGPAAMLQRPDR